MSITDTGPDIQVEDSTVVEQPREESVASATHDRPHGRLTFTITDAATACAVSRKTITRKLPELALSGAAKDDDGIWRIPVEALLAVGLHPGRSLPEDPRQSAERSEVAAGPAERVQPGPDMVTISRERWDDVRIRLARAEAEAAERGLALADARLALRALTAGPSAAHSALEQPAVAAGLQAANGGYVPVAPPAPVRKRRWWQSADGT